jgi:hypothetical protein
LGRPKFHAGIDPISKGDGNVFPTRVGKHMLGKAVCDEPVVASIAHVQGNISYRGWSMGSGATNQGDLRQVVNRVPDTLAGKEQEARDHGLMPLSLSRLRPRGQGAEPLIRAVKRCTPKVWEWGIVAAPTRGSPHTTAKVGWSNRTNKPPATAVATPCTVRYTTGREDW